MDLRIAVFASGGGTNFEALVNAIDAGTLRATIVLCVSNRSDAGVLVRSHDRGIATLVIKSEDFPTRDEYVDRLLSALENSSVNFIALAGYLRKIPSELVRRFRNRMVNIHPALLPSFGGKGMYGRRVHEAVLEEGVQWTGVTVHLVDDEYDTGPIVLQQRVEVKPGDTVDSLAARVLEIEHRAYPAALQLFADDRVDVDGQQVTISPAQH